MKTRKEATLIFKQITRTVYWRHPLPLSNWHGDQAYKILHKSWKKFYQFTDCNFFAK